MSYIYGLTLLLIYQLVGEVSALALRLPVPGPVLGMVLLFLTLAIKGGSSEALDSAANALLSHLSLLFVPAGVGLMVHFDRIAAEWLPISVALVLGAVITLASTAAIMQLSTKLLARRSPRG